MYDQKIWIALLDEDSNHMSLLFWNHMASYVLQPNQVTSNNTKQ